MELVMSQPDSNCPHPYRLELTLKKGETYHKKVYTIEQATYEANLICKSELGREIVTYWLIPVQMNIEDINHQTIEHSSKN